jgi:hypothetical protein
VLEIWDRICDLPVIKKLDLKLRADLWAAKDRLQEAGWHVDRRWCEEGVLRQWLSGLHVTCQEIRHTRPCVAKLRGGIDDWFVVVACISELDEKLNTCKAYDHFCSVHLLPLIAREGNVVQFATFSTEHDNSVIRHDLRAHSNAGGGRQGGVEDLEQLFQRRAVMRSLLVQSKVTWKPKQRDIEICGSCDCTECAKFYAPPTGDLLPCCPLEHV